MLSRADPGARLHWDGPLPVLTSGRPAPLRDIADRVAFTPVITPWQAGGGWGEKDKGAAQRLDALRASRSARLSALRAAIAVADTVTARRPGAGKDEVVLALRNALPDEAVPWLDAAVPLTAVPSGPQRVAVGLAPLAGTGGNDARWDISTNYHAAILALDPEREPRPDGSAGDDAVARRRARLHDLAGGTQREPCLEMSSGPYWPEATASGLVNPWALVLLAEGLCAFGDAGVAGSRHQAWTVRPGLDLEADASPGEAWLPVWGEPATMAEVARLLGGQQPSWRGRGARNPVQMYQSLASLGWPRGITGYARYGLARRRGQGHVAVPLDIATPQSAARLAVVLTAGQAAARRGVTEGTWRGYVSRGHAPQPDARDLRTGRPGWLESTIEAHLAALPGRGTRTDLDGP
jgi:CRISPR-associated protein Csx17